MPYRLSYGARGQNPNFNPYKLSQNRNVKRILYRALRKQRVTNGSRPGFTTSVVIEALSNLNPPKAAGPENVLQRLISHIDSKAVSQSIRGGFQCSPMKRKFLVLIDYSRAYDHIWRIALLLNMLRIGVPTHIITIDPVRLINRQSFCFVKN